MIMTEMFKSGHIKKNIVRNFKTKTKKELTQNITNIKKESNGKSVDLDGKGGKSKPTET